MQRDKHTYTISVTLIIVFRFVRLVGKIFHKVNSVYAISTEVRICLSSFSLSSGTQLTGGSFQSQLPQHTAASRSTQFRPGALPGSVQVRSSDKQHAQIFLQLCSYCSRVDWSLLAVPCLCFCNFQDFLSES